MNNKLKVGLLTAASSIALGAFLGITAQKAPVEAKATGVSGTISVDLTGEGWANNSGDEYGNGQNISVYFWDDEETPNTGWGSYEYAAYQQYVVFVDYDLGFTPTHMKAVRYSNWYEKSAWESDPWSENTNWGKWNESSNLDFVANGNIIIAGTSFVGTPYLHGQNSDTSWNWTTIDNLDGVKLNSSNHVEYYKDLTLPSGWNEFEVKISTWNDSWAYSVTSFSEYVNDSYWKEDVTNITRNDEAPSISIRIYFDRNAGTIYVNDPVHADADEWAQEFLGDECADSKSNWTASSVSYYAYATEYGTDFTELFTEPDHVDYDVSVEGYINEALQRYDYVLNLYGVYDAESNPSGYSDFLGRVGTKFTVSGRTTWGINAMNSDNGSAIVIASISAIGIATVAGFFLLKKRKEN